MLNQATRATKTNRLENVAVKLETSAGTRIELFGGDVACAQKGGGSGGTQVSYRGSTPAVAALPVDGCKADQSPAFVVGSDITVVGPCEVTAGTYVHATQTGPPGA